MMIRHNWRPSVHDRSHDHGAGGPVPPAVHSYGVIHSYVADQEDAILLVLLVICGHADHLVEGGPDCSAHPIERASSSFDLSLARMLVVYEHEIDLATVNGRLKCPLPLLIKSHDNSFRRYHRI